MTITTYGYYPTTRDGESLGIVLCTDCATDTTHDSPGIAPIDEWEPIWDADLPELDSQPHCDACGLALPCYLISERHVVGIAL